LALEAEVVARAGGVGRHRPSWATARADWQTRRVHWVRQVESCAAFAQLSLCLHRLQLALAPLAAMDRPAWLALLPEPLRSYVPEAGAKVVYIGATPARRAALPVHVQDTAVCGDEPAAAELPCACSVAGVRYFAGGGEPYALVTLQREAGAEVVEEEEAEEAEHADDEGDEFGDL
ncbi:MAG: hypothetical protein ACK41Y_16820, partial [Paracoccus hibiscisoli]|uniref:hypothetical protein n=1 Tax=Paracoccus hibiscisoli TaxID=2023261 RepID=UPI00391DCB95